MYIITNEDGQELCRLKESSLARYITDKLGLTLPTEVSNEDMVRKQT